MNIEGNTYLFYDKYCVNHGYTNPKTINIKLYELYSSDYKYIIGIDAINEFNKYGSIYTLPTDLDTDFYQLSFYQIPNINKDNEIKILTICVNHQKLKDHLNNIPNKNFLINACSYHCMYTTSENTQKDKKQIN